MLAPSDGSAEPVAASTVSEGAIVEDGSIVADADGMADALSELANVPRADELSEATPVADTIDSDDVTDGDG